MTASERRITSGERRRALRFALFAVILTSIPYLAAFWRAGEEWVFTGFLLGVDDGNSYIAKMLSGHAGAWLFRTPYSTHPQDGLFGLFLPYLALGKLAGGAALHLQLVALFHLFRAGAVFLVVHATYRFIAFFEPRPDYRFVGTVIATFGGGLGWLLLAAGRASFAGSLPLEFYSPETFGFLAVFGLPHLAAGRGLMLLGMLAWLEGSAGSRLRSGLLAGLFWVLAALFNPLSPVIALVVCGTLLVLLLAVSGLRGLAAHMETLKSLAAAAGLALPVVIYFTVISGVDPFFRAWSAQNTILSPPPLHYLAAYGVYLPLAFLGARRALRENLRAQLPALWVVLLPVLVYVPLNLQRRLADGLFVALAVLVVRGMQFRPPLVSLKTWLAAAAAMPSTLILLTVGIGTALSPGLPAFRPAAETASFRALAREAQVGDVVLAPLSSGNALPAFAPVLVVIGHGPETIGFDEIRPRVEAFFSGELSELEMRALLDAFGVDFVLWPDMGVEPMGGLREVFESGGYTVFRVED